jgi:hypothetical protein
VRRRLPAYARELADARRQGLVPDVGFIVVAMDWDLGGSMDGLVRVVVPPNHEPSKMDFSFLAGLNVILVHRDTDRDRATAIADQLQAVRLGELAIINVDLPTSDPKCWRLQKAARL